MRLAFGPIWAFLGYPCCHENSPATHLPRLAESAPPRITQADRHELRNVAAARRPAPQHCEVDETPHADEQPENYVQRVSQAKAETGYAALMFRNLPRFRYWRPTPLSRWTTRYSASRQRRTGGRDAASAFRSRTSGAECGSNRFGRASRSCALHFHGALRLRSAKSVSAAICTPANTLTRRADMPSRGRPVHSSEHLSGQLFRA